MSERLRKSPKKVEATVSPWLLAPHAEFPVLLWVSLLSGVLDIRTAGAGWEKQGSHSPRCESLTLEFYIGHICLAKFGKRRE